ncbi:MAG TPA: hypothetical protein VN958_17180, partial [Chitinophagaceae bacterium]|nr:hypothetical protein [Chitinophagaceae bacterium]
VDSMHVIITRTQNKEAYAEIVRKAQVTVANTYPHAHWINSDDWPTVGIHYTRLAQATLHGKAIATILLQILP